jgi:hypothetical protein
MEARSGSRRKEILMSRNLFSKTFATFALAGFFFSASPADLFRSWLGNLLNAETDQGPTVDPNGGRGHASATPDGDEGPGICPHGGHAMVRTDVGSTIDPNG